MWLSFTSSRLEQPSFGYWNILAWVCAKMEYPQFQFIIIIRHFHNSNCQFGSITIVFRHVTNNVLSVIYRTTSPFRSTVNPHQITIITPFNHRSTTISWNPHVFANSTPSIPSGPHPLLWGPRRSHQSQPTRRARPALGWGRATHWSSPYWRAPWPILPRRAGKRSSARQGKKITRKLNKGWCETMGWNDGRRFATGNERNIERKPWF